MRRSAGGAGQAPAAAVHVRVGERPGPPAVVDAHPAGVLPDERVSLAPDHAAGRGRQGVLRVHVLAASSGSVPPGLSDTEPDSLSRRTEGAHDVDARVAATAYRYVLGSRTVPSAATCPATDSANADRTGHSPASRIARSMSSHPSMAVHAAARRG